MVALIKIVVQPLAGVARFAIPSFSSGLRDRCRRRIYFSAAAGSIQRAWYKPRRVDAVIRISLVVLARFFDWRYALFVV